MQKLGLIVALFTLSFTAHAIGNTPCSGSKGGVNHCENSQFVCNDKTVSQSKQICTEKPKAKPAKKRRRSHKRHKVHHPKSS